jgi:hypothetical protein
LWLFRVKKKRLYIYDDIQIPGAEFFFPLSMIYIDGQNIMYVRITARQTDEINELRERENANHLVCSVLLFFLAEKTMPIV